LTCRARSACIRNAARATQLLAEAGYPNGLDAGEYFCDSSHANLGEAVANSLQAVGIRMKLRPLERAAFFSGTRLEAFVVNGAPTSTAAIPISPACFLNGVGPRVQESGLGLISGHAYSAPYEDVTLRGK
jgi:peptide/nickel transport system substrate-binding protein